MISETFIFGTLVTVMGACVGSFLNVCIHRLPYERSVVKPASHCPHCEKPIPWYYNIPLLSYLCLRGRCKFCGASISFRYFAVELLTALVFFGLFTYYGWQLLLIPFLVLYSGYIVATFVDFEHRIIPDEVSVGGMCAGMLFSLLIPELHDFTRGGEPVLMTHLKSFGVSCLGVLVGGGTIYMMGLLGDFIFKKESMGGGDVKLMAMIGAFLGWELALLTFFIAPFFGSVYGIAEKIRTGDTAIAYGPFLVLGAVISQFYGFEIIQWIINGYRF